MSLIRPWNRIIIKTINFLQLNNHSIFHFTVNIYIQHSKAKYSNSETWTIKARDTRRITAAETKYMRTTEYIWTDYRTNEQIANKLKMTPILDKLVEYKRK
jgi:hypothetical protein